jgi:hypothetical protein
MKDEEEDEEDEEEEGEGAGYRAAMSSNQKKGGGGGVRETFATGIGFASTVCETIAIDASGRGESSENKRRCPAAGVSHLTFKLESETDLPVQWAHCDPQRR